MLQILTQKEREQIHNTALRILEEVGVRIRDKRVYAKLLDAGATPHPKNPDALYFTAGMVKKHMEMCPKSFTVKDRNGNITELKSGAGALYYTSNGTLYTRGTSKKAVDIGEKELTDFIRVSDNLENVHGVVGTSIIEYPPQARDFAGFRLMAQNTYKHLRPCIYTPRGVDAIIEMADVILDGKSLAENMFFTLGYSIVSPLTWSETALDLMIRSSGHKIPFMINSEPMAGGTSPVTLAGSLASADAEVISGIVINQVLEPGRPCIYNAGFAHVFDMMTTIVLTGAPENALLQTAGAEMAAYHNLPCASWCLSDSNMLDSQASYEKLTTLMAHVLGKVNMVWGIGNIETSKTISPEVAVIDNELIGCSERFARGIIVDEERLAFDTIKEVGFGGSFLGTDNTLDFYREELRNSRLPSRVNRLIWEANGSKSIEERAENVVNGILSKKPNCYLSGTQMDKLMGIQKKYIDRIV